MRRFWPAVLCLLFAGCAMLDDHDSFYDPGFYEGGFHEPMMMPAQASYMPTTPPVAAPCNSCGAGNRPVHQTGYQTNEPPMLKPTAEPPK